MPKEKVTITVEPRILEWIDKKIQTFRFRNRSHAAEYALAKFIEREKK